jgi:hypothetical protein
MDHDVRPIINDVMESIIIHIEDKKTVSFNENYNTIFIIQSIDDKEYYHNKRDIWWSSIDFFHIRIEFRHEVLDYIEYYKNNSNINLSLRDAMTLLYQP